MTRSASASMRVAKAAAKEIAAGHVDGNGAFGGLAPEEVTGRLASRQSRPATPTRRLSPETSGADSPVWSPFWQSFYDLAMIVVSGAVGPAMLKVIESGARGDAGQWGVYSARRRRLTPGSRSGCYRSRGGGCPDGVCERIRHCRGEVAGAALAPERRLI